MKRPVSPVVESDLALRLLEEHDLSTTLDWRNREDMRHWFHTSAILSWEQHRQWFEAYRSADSDFVFVACVHGKPVGQASLYGIDWSARRAQFGRLVVCPERQFKGFGSRICRLTVQVAWRDLDLESLYLSVKENNVRAIAVYDAMGFQERHRQDGFLAMDLVRPESIA
jgi:UDP-4-amino-4,6-dideoxy-N-acetyl-beta-L-altrosamine N-acetyltransferase